MVLSSFPQTERTTVYSFFCILVPVIFNELLVFLFAISEFSPCILSVFPSWRGCHSRLGDWWCWLYWVPCSIKAFKRLVSCDNCGILSFMTSLFVYYSCSSWALQINLLILKDNLSRGNLAAVKILQHMFPEPGRLQFVYADLGDASAVSFLVHSIVFFGFLYQTLIS